MASGAILLDWLQDSYPSISTNGELYQNVNWSFYQNLSTTKYDDLSALTPYAILESFRPFSHKAVDIFAEYKTKDFTSSAAHLGLTTGAVLAFVLYFRLNLEERKIQVWLQKMVLRSLFVAMCLILALIAAPFVGVILITLMCYHQGVHIFLKLTQKHYVELFEGLDAVWAVEKETSKSVINALTFFEVENMEGGKNLLYTFRKLFVDRLATPPLPCAKLFYLRQQRLGYFYWENQIDIKIEDYIRPMKIFPSEYHSQFPTGIAEATLKNYIGEICNTTLPINNTASWEILVGSHPVIKWPTFFSEERFGQTLLYPILFRVHHSLGDGIALMQLLVSVITDNIQPTFSHKLPPMPMLARKFPNSSNAHTKYETIENVSQTQECCEREKTFVSRHQAQSPQNFMFKKISSKRQIPSDDIDSCSRKQNGNLLKANEIAIDLESIEENDIDLKSDFSDLDTSTKCIEPFRKTGNSSLLNCRQRPLVLNNNCEVSNQQQISPRHAESQWLSQNTCNESNDNPYPTPQHLQNFENMHGKFTLYSSKISSSYNQPFNVITPGNFSQSLSSNFQTSLPILNLCQSPKNDMKDHKLSSRISNPDPTEDNFDSVNNSTHSDQNIRCQSPTPTRMSLEKPLSLFNNIKQNDFHSAPKNLNKASKSSSSQNTTFLCYNRTMSDSYITIPEDLTCSSTEKNNSMSTTIYYYSPAASPVSPVEHSVDTEKTIAPLEQKLISTSLCPKMSSQCIDKNSTCEASSAESSFEDVGSITSSAHIKSCTSLPTNSFVCSSPMKPTLVKDCSTSPRVVQDLRWDSDSQNESKKTKSHGDLNEELQFDSLEFQIHSIDNTYAENKIHCTEKIRTISDNVEIQDLKKVVNSTNSHKINLNNHVEQYSHSRLQRMTANWNKFWSCIRGTIEDKNNNPDSQVSNQYVELLNTISNSNTNLNITNKYSHLIQTLCTIVLLPASVIRQVLMKPDASILHGPRLSGYKVIAWHRDEDGNLFNSIKRAKHISNTRFTEVFLSALSASLETYFETHQVTYNDRTPEVITVVTPARMEPVKSSTITNTTPVIVRKDIKQNPKEDNRAFEWPRKCHISEIPVDRKISIERDRKLNDCTVPLNNRFSIAMLQLPICQKGDKYIRKSPKSRLKAVHHQSQLLRTSVDYQVNYWLLKVMATYLPEAVLSAAVQSSQSTMVISNIMGPTQELSIAGNKLKDIIFWVPNRDMTGIGITVLSYMEHLEIGLIADRALIHSKEDAQMILDELAVEICKLDAALSQTAAGSTHGHDMELWTTKGMGFNTAMSSNFEADKQN